MRATPPARLLAWLVDVLDRFWGPLAIVAILALEALVFAPRQWMLAVILAGCAGAAIMVVWMWDRLGG